MPAAVVSSIHVAALQIPLRGRVSHASSLRGISDAVVVRLELQGGLTGYGETLPREYVTGETVESVQAAIREVYVPWLVTFHADSFPSGLAAIDALPWTDSAGKSIPAARAGVELALLHALCLLFDRDIQHVVQWMGLPELGAPGSLSRIRFSGVLASETRSGTIKRLRLMRWGGIRDYKLKVGFGGDRDRLADVCRYLKRPLAAGKCTLRLDANGAWMAEDAITWLTSTSGYPYEAIEQPLDPLHDDDLPLLRGATEARLIHDESLRVESDAERLADLEVADVFNVRISKCGGLMPSLSLAVRAYRRGTRVVLGCMVGETSILSSAALCFLQVFPHVWRAEGCFGSFLLREDVTRHSLRFGFGGRPPRRHWGFAALKVDEQRLSRLAADVKDYHL